MKKWLTGLLNTFLPLCAAGRVLGLEINTQHICGVLLQHSAGETRVIHEFTLPRCRRDTPAQVQEVLRMLPYRPLLLVVCGISPERMALENGGWLPACLWMPPGGSAGLALLQQQNGTVAGVNDRLPEFEQLQHYGLRLPEHQPAMKLALQPLYRRHLLRAGLSRGDYRLWRLNKLLPPLLRGLALLAGVLLLAGLFHFRSRPPEPLPAQMMVLAPVQAPPEQQSVAACPSCTEHWRH